MKKVGIGMLAAVALVVGQTRGADLITNVDGRTTMSLNGKWETIIDPYEAGYYDYRYEPSSNGYFKNRHARDKSDLVEYDFDESQLLNVPGDWNTQKQELLFYEGTVWYKKSFDYQKKPGTRVFLYFGAANYQAHVYLNGEKLGEHTGGFTPFDFEITSLLRDEDNFVVVKVDNTRHREALPTLNTDWWNYGGLTRRVMLIEVPSVFIEDYFIQLSKGSQNHVSGWVKINGDHPSQTVRVQIPEAGVDRSFEAGPDGRARVSFDATLGLWSPENPKLYDVVISTPTDTVHDSIGFRTIEARGTDILLNGKPVFLRGVCIHEEAPFRSGRAFSEADARTLLGWAKELGCNFVRLAHYPHNEFMTRQADRMGLMVWSEIPVYWTILWENPATLENARNQLTEMVARDKDKASVVLWSMANETPRSDERLVFLRQLTELARTLDPTRLITAATEVHYTDPHTLTIDDPLGQYLDVLGCNEYLGWYDGLPEKCDTVQWKSAYDKPLIMSELGGGALYGDHGDPLTRWTEEFQENIYNHQIPMLKKIAFLRGMTPWILMDFRSPRRPLPRIQDFFNRKGLISNRGQKKKAFFVLQKFYEEKAAASVRGRQ
ncbi:MAG: glycoside hydrolase family 2 TIM barrel-domain containing protein [Acidobacteriota bacterium]